MHQRRQRRWIARRGRLSARAPRDELRCNHVHGVDGNPIARQWVWRRLQGGADGCAVVPYGEQERVLGELVCSQQGQLDGVHTGSRRYNGSAIARNSSTESCGLTSTHPGWAPKFKASTELRPGERPRLYRFPRRVVCKHGRSRHVHSGQIGAAGVRDGRVGQRVHHSGQPRRERTLQRGADLGRRRYQFPVPAERGHHLVVAGARVAARPPPSSRTSNSIGCFSSAQIPLLPITETT